MCEKEKDANQKDANQMDPNSLKAADAATMTRTSTAAQRNPSDSGAPGRGKAKKPARILRVQLVDLSDDQRYELRNLAAESARFCNATMADKYCEAMGYPAHPDGTAFTRMKGQLSGDVRVALGREAFTAWRKQAKLVLAGVRRLAEFSADRALVCRAEHMSKGVRQRRAMISFDGAAYRLSMRLIAAKQCENKHEYKLWWKPQADSYIEPVLQRLASGKTRLLKISFIYEKSAKKVFALLSYEAESAVPAAGQRMATLGPLEETGELWLRFEMPQSQAPHFNYTGHVSRMTTMKNNYTGIHDRIKRRMRRSGKGWRHDYRASLVKAGSFSAWAHGFLHEWSADIVDRCKRAGVGYLAIFGIKHKDLPMAELESKLIYKCQEAGIIVQRPDPEDKTTGRAIKGAVSKKQRSIAKARKSLSYLKSHLKKENE